MPKFLKTKISLGVLFLFFISFLLPVNIQAQDEGEFVDDSSYNDGMVMGVESEVVEPEVTDEYSKAVVLEIVEEGVREIAGVEREVQIIKIQLESGPEKGKELELEYDSFSVEEQKVDVGDKIVVNKSTVDGQETYYVEDHYRITPIIIVAIIFALFIIAFGKFKGFTSLLGLAFSFLIIIKFIIPLILEGQNPLLVSFFGSLVILIISLYLAHGLNKKTSVALLSSLITLIFAVAIGISFVNFTKLFGFGSENAVFLQVGLERSINMRGLLLGAIIIGTLGVLDDITVGQTAIVAELKKANAKLSIAELYKRGLNVGREHVASMVNTLVLAYAGASLPLLMLFTQSQGELWVTVNSEFIAEEIIRSLVGSSVLVLSVPISTFIAAMVLGKNKNQK